MHSETPKRERRRTIRVAAMLAVLGCAQSSFAQLYFSEDYNGGGLYTLDTATGAATNLGTSGVTSATVGLAPSGDPAVLFGSQWSQLLEINADGSGFSVVGGVGTEGLAYDPSTGTLYGSINGDFFLVDPLTGANVGTLASPGADIEGLAWGRGGVFGLPGTGSDLMFYNPGLDSWSLVGDTGIFWDSTGLAYDPIADVLYAKGNQDSLLYVIDPNTGGAVVVGDTGIPTGGGLAFLTSCGDGVLDAGELCDDGNNDDGDCCSSSCGMPSTCETSVGKALFLSKESVAGKEKMIAKFLKGPALTQTQLGDPLAGTTVYNLCVWDDSGNLVGTYTVDRAGDVCTGGSANCWKPIGKAPPDGKGYKFTDKDLASDGVKKAILKGGDAGKSKLIVKGKGSNLPGVAGGLAGSSSVTLQLHVSDSGECVEATLFDIKKAEADFFKAK